MVIVLLVVALAVAVALLVVAVAVALLVVAVAGVALYAPGRVPVASALSIC